MKNNSGNGRVAFDFKSIGIDPSTLLGLEVDSEGNVYTANYRNSVYIINPRWHINVSIIIWYEILLIIFKKKCVISELGQNEWSGK